MVDTLLRASKWSVRLEIGFHLCIDLFFSSLPFHSLWQISSFYNIESIFRRMKRKITYLMPDFTKGQMGLAVGGCMVMAMGICKRSFGVINYFTVVETVNCCATAKGSKVRNRFKWISNVDFRYRL